MNADEFHDYLIEIVKPRTSDVLSWSSESDIPVEVIKMPCWKLWPIPSTMLWGRFANQAFTNQENRFRFLGWRELHQRRGRFDWQETKRPGKEPSEYIIYLVVRFGWHWIGLRCKTVET